jgi:hypothetical protein
MAPKRSARIAKRRARGQQAQQQPPQASIPEVAEEESHHSVSHPQESSVAPTPVSQGPPEWAQALFQRLGQMEEAIRQMERSKTESPSGQSAYVGGSASRNDVQTGWPRPKEHSSDFADRSDKFRKKKPPTYDETEDPADADEWIYKVEQLFVEMKGTEQEKVIWATRQLTGVASSWWRHLQATRPEVEYYEWSQFREIFLRRFFPARAKDRLQAEFENLKQDDMSVSQYSKEFSRLLRYAPGLAATEEAMVRKFQNGLRMELRHRVSEGYCQTYADVVERALLVETNHKEFKEARVERQKRKGGPPGGVSESGPRTQSRRIGGGPVVIREQSQMSVRNGRPPRDTSRQVGACYVCGQLGHHANNCFRRVKSTTSVPPGACFSCGQLGHKRSECPRSSRGLSPSQVPRGPRQVQQSSMGSRVPPASGVVSQSGLQPVQGRVFNLTQQDALASNEVVAGNFCSSLFLYSIVFYHDMYGSAVYSVMT